MLQVGSNRNKERERNRIFTRYYGDHMKDVMGGTCRSHLLEHGVEARSISPSRHNLVPIFENIDR
jgi:hypothetical protein